MAPYALSLFNYILVFDIALIRWTLLQSKWTTLWDKIWRLNKQTLRDRGSTFKLCTFKVKWNWSEKQDRYKGMHNQEIFHGMRNIICHQVHLLTQTDITALKAPNYSILCNKCAINYTFLCTHQICPDHFSHCAVRSS